MGNIKRTSFNKPFLISFTFLLLIVNNSQGQTENDLKNNFGLNIFSCKYFSETHTPNKYGYCFPSGIIYKRTHDHFTSRYSINYSKSKAEIEFLGPDSYGGYNYHSILSASSGIQKDFNHNKWSFFIGTDLFVNLSIYKLDYYGGYSGGGLHRTDRQVFLGLGPLIGIKYNFSKRLAIALETSYNISYLIVNQYEMFEPYLRKFQNYLNPINGLTIFYKF